MKLIDLTLTEFINQVDSNAPAPGGGSVSALISTLGISLARMVGHLSVTKKKFIQLDTSIKDDFNNHLNHLKVIKDEMLLLIDKDTDAFNDIMKAYQIPKEEQEKRKNAIHEATLKAIEIPYRVCITSYKALETLSFILAYSNKQTVSDLGVATLSLATGIEGAAMNVLINLPSLNDDEQKNIYQQEVKQILKDTHHLKQEILNLVYEYL